MVVFVLVIGGWKVNRLKCRKFLSFVNWSWTFCTNIHWIRWFAI